MKFTVEIEEGDARPETPEQSQVDEHSAGVVLDEPREARRVVGVVPLVRRQDQLGERVGQR